MSTSIHRAVWDWLKSCPDVQKLSFNYGTARDGQMLIRPTRSVSMDFMGGKKLYEYRVELTVFKPLTFDANDDGNIGMLEQVDSIAEWIHDRSESGDLPILPDGYAFDGLDLYEAQTEFAIAMDGAFAKYVIPFTITYIA